MNNKRKIGCDPEDGNSMSAKWADYRAVAGKKMKERVNAPKRVPEKKGHYVNYITTRRVRYDEGKKKYIPLEDKQSIRMMCHMDYDVAYKNILEYYKSEGLQQTENFTMHIITGVFGPKVKNTLQLENKKDLYILFEPNNNEASVSYMPIFLSSDTTNQRKDRPKKKEGNSKILEQVPLTALPKITPSAIRQAAKVVSAKLDVVVADISKFMLLNGKWTWTPAFKIKCTLGKEFSSGSFRKAHTLQIIDYGELPLGAYIFKSWNALAIDGRKIESEHTDEITISEDLSKRAVQCQAVARGLAEMAKDSAPDNSFGEHLEYIPSYLMTMPDAVGTIEPKLNGAFVKYINNTMQTVLINNEYTLKCEALAHYSFAFSDGKILLTDMQGVGRYLTDPEIASLERYDASDSGCTSDLNYGFGNYGGDALDHFKYNHQCNKYCKILNLKAIDTFKTL